MSTDNLSLDNLSLEQLKMLRAQLARCIHHIHNDHPFEHHPEWNNTDLLQDLIYFPIHNKIKQLEPEG